MYLCRVQGSVSIHVYVRAIMTVDAHLGCKRW